MYSYGSPHTAAQKQDDQHERTFSSYVRIQVVVLKTYLGRWTIGRSGERGSGISVLPARYDDDDDDIYTCFYLFVCSVTSNTFLYNTWSSHQCSLKRKHNWIITWAVHMSDFIFVLQLLVTLYSWPREEVMKIAGVIILE